MNDFVCRKVTKNKFIIFLKNGKHTKKAANLIFLTIAVFFFVFQLHQTGNISAVVPAVGKYFTSYSYSLLSVLLLSVAQLFAEAERWQKAIHPVCHLSFRQARESVFRGVLLNSFLPFGIGNLAGKMSEISPNRYANAGFELAAAGFWQNFVGVICALFFLLFGNFFLAFSALILLIFVLAASRKMAAQKYFFSERLGKILQSGRRVLAITLLKHFIFMVQYVILLCSGKELDIIFNAATGASFVLGIKSLLPTGNFWTSFFFRENIAAEILQKSGLSFSEIFASGLLLGFCNHIFTALFAGLFLLLIPIFQNENNCD